jgi:hypothetical protein
MLINANVTAALNNVWRFSFILLWKSPSTLPSIRAKFWDISWHNIVNLIFSDSIYLLLTSIYIFAVSMTSLNVLTDVSFGRQFVLIPSKRISYIDFPLPLSALSPAFLKTKIRP